MIHPMPFFLKLEYELEQSQTPKSVLLATWVNHNIIKDFKNVLYYLGAMTLPMDLYCWP